MEMIKNADLKLYSTMRLGGKAAFLIEVGSRDELIGAVKSAKEHGLPFIVIGMGSNIVWRDEGFNGLVIVNRIKGFDIVSDDDVSTYITIGAGEEWDYAVQRSVEMGLSGIECLSLIPGTAGATPVQNVGAYGQEIAQAMVSLTAYDAQMDKLVTLATADCGFGYRNSIFKTTAAGRYLITDITLMLSKTNLMPPFYVSLGSYLEQHNIKDYSPASIRNAVIDIRQHKLPDPKLVANNGSFMANPVVDRSVLANLEDKYGSVPSWPSDNDKVKIPAAWLIDRAGFHDYYDEQTGMATWPTQSLVFINKSAKSSADLIKFVDKVKTKVKQDFNIELSQEPLILP